MNHTFAVSYFFKNNESKTYTEYYTASTPMEAMARIMNRYRDARIKDVKRIIQP